MEPWMGYGSSYQPQGGQSGSVFSNYAQAPMNPFTTGGAPNAPQLDITQTGNLNGPENVNGQRPTVPGNYLDVNGQRPTLPGNYFGAASNSFSPIGQGYNPASQLYGFTQGSWGSGYGTPVWGNGSPNGSYNGGSNFTGTNTPWQTLFGDFNNEIQNLNSWNQNYGTQNANAIAAIGGPSFVNPALPGIAGTNGNNAYNNFFNYDNILKQIQGNYQQAYNAYGATGQFGVPQSAMGGR